MGEEMGSGCKVERESKMGVERRRGEERGSCWRKRGKEIMKGEGFVEHFYHLRCIK